jgi:hypothetical protein
MISRAFKRVEWLNCRLCIILKGPIGISFCPQTHVQLTEHKFMKDRTQLLHNYN